MKIESKISNFSFDEGRFVTCKIDVAHDKMNHNNTWFDAEVLEMCAKKSLLCSPILANVFKNESGEYEIGGHDMDFDLLDTENGLDVDIFYVEKPVGFVPHDAPIEMIYNPEDERYHLHTMGVIWKNYSNQLLNYMEENNNELSVSMEIEVTNSHVAVDGSTVVEDFVFNGITILGKDIKPAMDNAKIVKAFSMDDIKAELKEMIKVYALEQKGGETMEEEVKEVVVKEEETTTVEVDGEVVEEETKVKEDRSLEDPNEDPMNCPPVDCPMEPMDPMDDEFACGDKKKKKYEDDEEDDKEDDDDFACKKKKYEELEEEYAALQQAYSELQAKLDSMADYEELKAFKDAYDTAAYEKEVEEVSEMFPLAEEEYAELKEQVMAKEISVEQYKEKLGFKFAMKQISSKKFSKEEKVSSEISVMIKEEKVDAPYGGKFEKYRTKK